MKRRPDSQKIDLKKRDSLSAAGMKRVLKDAGARVATENLQRGVAITVIKDGKLVRIQPDNTSQVLSKKVEPRVTITQTRFRLG